jgi:hypothetical protein
MPQPSSTTRGKIAEGLRILMRAGGLDFAGADFMRIYAGGPHPSAMDEKDVKTLHQAGLALGATQERMGDQHRRQAGRRDPGSGAGEYLSGVRHGHPHQAADGSRIHVRRDRVCEAARLARGSFQAVSHQPRMAYSRAR